MRKVVVFLFLSVQSVFAGFDYTVNNTNITISQDSMNLNQDKTYLYNYNRLRFNTNYSQDKYFATMIFDGVNYFGDDYIHSNTFEYMQRFMSNTPYKTESNYHDYENASMYAKLYRFYLGYEDNKNRVVIGLQNITMGVGRIWTPTNIFNARNSYALEPDEVFGVSALSYTRYMDDTSSLMLVTSQNRENDFKYCVRYKAFLGFADMAVNVISADNTKMVGYEIEGNLADTGIELRSEGALIKSTLKSSSSTGYEKDFFQGILGADYGFENGLSIVVEALYSSEVFSYEEILLNYNADILSNFVYSRFHTGVTLQYSFNLFLDASLLYIESFDDKNSRFISPTLRYTLDDYNSFTIGAMIQDIPKRNGFGVSNNTYYFKYALSF